MPLAYQLPITDYFAMHIAFDASDLCTNRADGTTRYTSELVKRLPQLAPQDIWSFLAPCGQPSSAPVAANASWHASPWPKYWTQSRLPLDLFRMRPDVLFMPIQQLPLIRPGKTKIVTVIHDLAVYLYPEQFTYKDWLLLHIFSAQAAREADVVIAVSQVTADDIAHYYGRTKNVFVVHHGVDHQIFRLPSESEREASWDTLKQAHPKLRDQYVLYVGQIQPRKNLIRLIEAFELIKPRHPQVQLVIAGGHGWLKKPILDRVKSSKHEQDILVPGRISDTLLPALYWHASVFALVSLYEGFGIPIIEAMACGTPVVTSNISSMPEVAGNAAVLVDPQHSQSIADGIETALRDGDQYRALGLARAKSFSWDKAAQQTLDVIRNVF